MTRVLVLGGGMVGSILADDLAREPGFAVTLADRSEASLARAGERCPALRLERADLSDPALVRALAERHDVVCGALASHLGLAALRAVIEARRPYADISFMADDADVLSDLARERGVTAIVDCGVAPGMSNLLAAWGVSLLDEARSVEIMVGGLPRERRWPWEYKAGFAPADVIEEYVRPSRIVVDGRQVVREALSEPELVDFDGLGTLEAFLTDGLRSLAKTLAVPDMQEKTLRYPGHIERMRALREAGFFSKEEIQVGGVRVRPLDVTSALLFPQWTYEPGEEDLTVMRIAVRGTEGGREVEYRWDLFDLYSREHRATSMSRTTALPCAVVARWLAKGELDRPGVHAPEVLGCNGWPERMLAALEDRGVHYTQRRTEL